MQYMGDEQKSTPLLRFVAPTDFDRARDAINTIIRDKYPGLDWLNPDLWRKLGLGGDKVAQFLNRYMLMARERGVEVTEGNKLDYELAYTAKYADTYHEDIVDYLDAMLEATGAGMIADTILRPWTYEPETPLDELMRAVSVPVAAGFDKLLMAGAVVAIVYFLGRTFILKR